MADYLSLACKVGAAFMIMAGLTAPNGWGATVFFALAAVDCIINAALAKGKDDGKGT